MIVMTTSISTNEKALRDRCWAVLRSLETQGLLSSEREMSDSGPPRKYYQTTERGKETLETWTGIWEETKSFVDKVLGGDYQ